MLHAADRAAPLFASDFSFRAVVEAAPRLDELASVQGYDDASGRGSRVSNERGGEWETFGRDCGATD